MDLEAIYENVERRDFQKTTGPQTQSQSQDEGKDLKHSKHSYLVMLIVSLYKNTAEEFNQTINSLQDNYTDLMTEKHQLQNNFNSLSQKNLEDFKSLNEKNGSVCFFMSSELKSWSDSRQYCRERGADLVIINTEEKQVSLCECLLIRIRKSFIAKYACRVWIGLSDREQEGVMKWVDNSTLKQGFWIKGEPNDEHGIEDCIELTPSHPALNWNDLPCSEMRKGFCEK
uniref:Si:ch73-343l4.8 n=1 Tax=Cyprinus carpio carpio TaxID=630221 RepID=A0A8C1AYN6_CYPCA